MVTRCGGSVKPGLFWFMLGRPTAASWNARREKHKMNDQLAAALFWLILLTPIGVFARQIRQLRRGLQRGLRATLLFFAFSMLPALAFIACFLLLVGAEELTSHPLIGEGFARMALPLVVISGAEVVLLTLVFGVAARLLHRPPPPQPRQSD